MNISQKAQINKDFFGSFNHDRTRVKDDHFHNILEGVSDCSKNSKPSNETQLQVCSSGHRFADGLPLEALSLPPWYGDLMTDYNIIEAGSIGKKYTSTNQYRYECLSSKAKRNVSEYENNLHTIFQSKLNDFGIKNNEDYYEAVILNKEKSEAIHQAVRAELKNDPRMVELMDFFKIQ